MSELFSNAFVAAFSIPLLCCNKQTKNERIKFFTLLSFFFTYFTLLHSRLPSFTFTFLTTIHIHPILHLPILVFRDTRYFIWL
ncbi:MAG: hypothetical protein J3R72DRAFT_453764 [Linnemannia gamsii]|nr:MAG: hypothetical protein J3R72DRAFT_453764 [Linnemannia gamsii]